MGNRVKEIQGFSNEFVEVLKRTGTSNSKGSVEWYCKCKFCGNTSWVLTSSTVPNAKGCSLCKHERRRYEEVTRKCCICDSSFTCKNNTRTKTCSESCKKKLLSQRAIDKIQSSVENKLRATLSGCLSRRKFRDSSCLDIERIVKEVEAGGWRCCKTGIPFETKGQFAPSVDRVDPDKPYLDDNVQIVCWIYNRAKQSDTDEDVLYFAKKLLEQQEK